MGINRYQTRILHKLLTIGVLACLLIAASCSFVGPTSIRNGRLAYNDAITETNNQQLLMGIIHNRYEEKGSLLAVTSVTANVSVKTNAGVQFGFGDFDNYAGNLVPFRAGTVYEENPTISYTPVEGQVYSTQLFSPLPVTVLTQLTGTMTDPSYIYTTLVASVNGIRNPDFLFAQSKPDQRFERFVSILTVLTQAQRLHWLANPQQAGSFSMVIDHYAPAYTAEVSELLDLLGLPAPKAHSAQVVLPTFLALDGRKSGAIGLITRSIYDLVEILSAAVEVPEEDQRNGLTVNYPAPGLAGKELRIRHSKARPEHATVAVKHRDNWFYIDETDQATKRFFRIMSALWSVSIAESTLRGSVAPVLTVPVSR